MLLSHCVSWRPSGRGGKKIIQEDHGGDHRHRSRSGRLSLLHSAKFRNNFSATSRRKYDDYILYSSSNFAAPRNFLGEREITQNSWRWVSQRVADGSDDPFCVAVLELRPPSEGLQSLSRDESRGRNWSPSLHNAHSWAPSSIYYLEVWSVRSVSQKSLAGGVMWIADLLHLLRVVGLSVCLFAQKRAILRPTCVCA